MGILNTQENFNSENHQNCGNFFDKLSKKKKEILNTFDSAKKEKLGVVLDKDHTANSFAGFKNKDLIKRMKLKILK